MLFVNSVVIYAFSAWFAERCKNIKAIIAINNCSINEICNYLKNDKPFRSGLNQSKSCDNELEIY